MKEKIWNQVPQPNDMRWYERLMVRRFHPRWLMVHAAAAPWIVVFLWTHDWDLALLLGAIATFAGLAATAEVDPHVFRRTTLGRIALLHVQPANFAVQVLSSLLLVWSVWEHSLLGLLLSVSGLFLGHLGGWDEVWPASEAPAARPEYRAAA